MSHSEYQEQSLHRGEKDMALQRLQPAQRAAQAAAAAAQEVLSLRFRLLEPSSPTSHRPGRPSGVSPHEPASIRVWQSCEELRYGF